MLKGSSKKVNITPPIGLRMAGYGARKHANEGILNQLYANILVLDDENTKVAFVTLDLIGVDKALAHEVRTIVSEKTDIPYHSIMLVGSHTHSGPEAARFGDMGRLSRRIEPTPIDSAYNTLLPQLIANGVVWANAHLEPVTFGVVQSQLQGLGSNRIDPSRYVDNTVTVFRFDRLNAEPLCIMTQYTCHPTVLNADSYLYSGDFVSFYQETVEKVYQGSVAMFIQGCAGDVSTRHNRKFINVPEVTRMGRMLAGEVIKDVTWIDTVADVKISAAIEPLRLDVRKFASDEDCESRINAAQAECDRLVAENAPEPLQRTAFVSLDGAKRYLAFKKSIDIDHIDIEMQRISIGDWNIITTPGETFGEIGQRIRELDPHRKTVVTGYSNGYVGYIPTKVTYEDPMGYEIASAIVDEHSEDNMVEAAKKLLASK